MASRPLVLNGKWLSATPTGVQRYATEVARRIVEAEPTARVIVPADAALPDWLSPSRVIRSRFRGAAFEQLALPWLARGAMLLNLAASAPLIKREQLVVMPDMITARFPGTFSRRFVIWYAVMYRVLARRTRHLLTISEFSRRELATVLGVPPARFALAPAGHEHVLDGVLDAVPIDPELASRMREPYVLCIGSLTPSKNLAPVTAALAADGIRVIVVGAAGVRRVYAEESGLVGPGIWLAGRLTDAELAQLLRHADALVFPSLYEGFGLPIVEAQALSCPVIASDRASIPEVAGDGALYFDPLVPQQAVALVRGLTDAERRRLVANGHRNAARFSWDAPAATILSIATGAGQRVDSRA
jgi:glycosyltransferase involved in cell wall biosynthesis